MPTPQVDFHLDQPYLSPTEFHHFHFFASLFIHTNCLLLNPNSNMQWKIILNWNAQKLWLRAFLPSTINLTNNPKPHFSKCGASYYPTPHFKKKEQGCLASTITFIWFINILHHPQSPFSNTLAKPAFPKIMKNVKQHSWNRPFLNLCKTSAHHIASSLISLQ
jgi:hypothetical protein